MEDRDAENIAVWRGADALRHDTDLVGTRVAGALYAGDGNCAAAWVNGIHVQQEYWCNYHHPEDFEECYATSSCSMDCWCYYHDDAEGWPACAAQCPQWQPTW
jgi:hypothetical protein